jgi:hypothetical protein
MALSDAARAEFIKQYNRWDRLPIKPTPGNVMRSVILSTPLLRDMLRVYMNDMAQVLDFITTASGMSLEGYCKLQEDTGLSYSEVDMFLVTTGKKRDGFAGLTPFGFTLEDLQTYFKFVKASVNQRLLKQAFNVTGSFFLGSTQYAADGCKVTAGETERKRSETGSALDPGSVADWKASGGEEQSCLVALGPDMTDVKSGLPVIPLWARFGSHRILKIDDAVRALNNFERYVTPKPDYPEFVSYVLYKVPRLNRPLLAPSQISQMCSARPGPASAFLFPPTGILSQAAIARNVGALTPWSILFTPTPRIAGRDPQSAAPAATAAAGVAPSRPHTMVVQDQSFGAQYKRLVGGRRLGGVAPQRRRKARSSSRSKSKQIAQDQDHLPIDAVFRLQ